MEDAHMKEKLRSVVILSLSVGVILMASTRLPADTGTCASHLITLPFTDVMGNTFFCQIAEAYFSGLTNGTTPMTYNPSNAVLRDQMAAFVTRTQDAALRRGSRRAALNQWATPGDLTAAGALLFAGRSTVGQRPELVASDGADLWVANNGDNSVTRVRASDGRVLGTFTGAVNAFGVLVARGLVWVTGATNPGALYAINPANEGGVVGFPMVPNIGDTPLGIAFDGNFIWTANVGHAANTGSVSKYDLANGDTTIFTGFGGNPQGILFDGTYIWVTDVGDNTLKRLHPSGSILQSVAVGSEPQLPVFDGSNIWVPNFGDYSVSVIRARDGQVLATLTGNGLIGPVQATFDGQRILVTNGTGNSVSLWMAADLTPLGSVATGINTSPWGACSDGINFWIVLKGANQLARL
jgi:hypothetical protein